MSVTIGSKAPNFKLESADGEKVKLTDFRGRNVVLYFYPKDLTQACTQQACDLRDANTEMLEWNTVIIGISMDAPKTHVKFRDKYELPFILLSDPDHAVCEAFGVWQQKILYGREYMGIVRSTFLIDKKGIIIREWRNIRVKGHAEQVLSAVRETAKKKR